MSYLYPAAKLRKCTYENDSRRRKYTDLQWHQHSGDNDETVQGSKVVQVLTEVIQKLKGWFILEKGNNSITVGSFTGHTVSGTRLMKELQYTGTDFDVKIAGKTVAPECFLISSEMTRLGIQTAILLMDAARVCSGYPASKSTPNVEQWHTDGDENSAAFQVRSQRCMGYLPFKRHLELSVCPNCQTLKKSRTQLKKRKLDNMDSLPELEPVLKKAGMSPACSKLVVNMVDNLKLGQKHAHTWDAE